MTRPDAAKPAAIPFAARLRAAGVLTGGEVRAHRGRYASLVAVVAVGVAILVVVHALGNGLETGLGQEITDTLAADYRVGREPWTLSDHAILEDADRLEMALEGRVAGATASTRLEVPALIVRENPFRLEAIMLVGYEPATDAGLDGLRKHLVEGEMPPGERVIVHGDAYAPVLVGTKLLDTLDGEDLEEDEASGLGTRVNLTAGRITGRPGSTRALYDEGMVWGTYETGFEMIDRYVVFAPISLVRELAGHGALSPVGNVVLVDGGDRAEVDAVAAEYGYNVSDADRIRDGYLAPVLATVNLFRTATVVIVALLAAGWTAWSVTSLVHADARKLGILDAVGIPRDAVAGTYLAAAAACGVAGSVAGLILGGLATLVLDAFRFRIPGASGLDLPLHVPLGQAGALAALGTLTALAGAAFGIVALRRVNPARLLRRG